MRPKIDKAIQRLLEIGRQFDPLPILSEFAFNRLFRDPESGQPGKEAAEAECEHLASLFLSQPLPVTLTPPTADMRGGRCVPVMPVKSTRLSKSTRWTISSVWLTSQWFGVQPAKSGIVSCGNRIKCR